MRPARTGFLVGTAGLFLILRGWGGEYPAVAGPVSSVRLEASSEPGGHTLKGSRGRLPGSSGPGRFPASSRPAEAEPPFVESPVDPVALVDDGAPLADVPTDQRYHPWLPPLHDLAISMGTTRDGFLLRGAPLPDDDATLRIMPRQKARELGYGTTGLIRALVDAAHAVDSQFPGAVLHLGDLSARDGGDIPWSVSHNAGRDADIAFYYRDARGGSIEPDDFITVNARGVGSDPRFRFDVERNWALVKALISHPDVRVQWLFLYAPLRDRLLKYARASGEPAELVARAAELVGQPSDGAPHNDHLHLRVMCSDEDLREGCRDMGRIPSFVRPPAGVLAARAHMAWEYLEHEDPERRARAAELLGILGVADAGPMLVRRLRDSSPRVRVAAARGLERLAIEAIRVEASSRVPDAEDDGEAGEADGAESAPGTWSAALVDRLAQEQDPAVIEAWTAVLIRQGETAAIPLLERWIHDPEAFPTEARHPLPGDGLYRNTFPGLPSLASRGFPLDQPLKRRSLAAVALGELEAASAIPALITLLADKDPEVQRSAGWALEVMTNRAGPASALEPGAIADAYAEWFERNGAKGRNAWLMEGFRAAGYPVGGLDLRSSRALLRALAGPPAVAWNANRTLCRITGARPPESACSFEATRDWWEMWLRREQRRSTHASRR